MIIGGYQPFTLTDFPGMPAAVVFVQGCNLLCPYCHNGDLRPRGGPPPRGAPDTQEVLTHLKERRRQLGGVVLSGGEPTVCADLSDFITEIRCMGYRVKLDTNATRPAVLHSLIQAGLLDYVAADVKAPPDKYDRLTGAEVNVDEVRRSCHMIASSGLPHLFRTTWIPDLLDESDARRIEEMIPTGSPHRWQRFIRENAADPALRHQKGQASPGEM